MCIAKWARVQGKGAAGPWCSICGGRALSARTCCCLMVPQATPACVLHAAAAEACLCCSKAAGRDAVGAGIVVLGSCGAAQC